MAGYEDNFTAKEVKDVSDNTMIMDVRTKLNNLYSVFNNAENRLYAIHERLFGAEPSSDATQKSDSSVSCGLIHDVFAQIDGLHQLANAIHARISQLEKL